MKKTQIIFLFIVGIPFSINMKLNNQGNEKQKNNLEKVKKSLEKRYKQATEENIDEYIIEELEDLQHDAIQVKYYEIAALTLKYRAQMDIWDYYDQQYYNSKISLFPAKAHINEIIKHFKDRYK